MSILIVVGNPRDWPLPIPGVSVVTAKDYLTGPAYGNLRTAAVLNLCKSYRYQSLGYYVSLLAEARGHKPLPRVHTLEDLQSQNLVRLLTEDIADLIQRSLAPLPADACELTIYFGRDLERRHEQLSRQLFNLLQAPLLRAQFKRLGKQWQVHSVRPLAASDIPAAQQEFAVQTASDYLQSRSRRTRTRQRPAPRFSLAILHDPDNPEPPSNAKAMRKFEQAAAAAGLHAELIKPSDFSRLPQFDALFIRDTTFVNHYTYRFARRAAAEGLVVIDDPDSILKCNNKVYLAELLGRHGIPTPKTLMVHRGNWRQIIPALGLPCVLKRPDSSFSLGVLRVDAKDELWPKVSALLARSELIVAQEYLPTEFDWRVGILDQRPLFACKYFMAAGHWQIIKHEQSGRLCEGPTLALPLQAAPKQVIEIALAAANLIGDGFYGVDLKQTDGRYCVIEINDNPNVDAGNEDGVLKDALYREIMDSFVRRIEQRKLRGCL